MEKIHIHGAAIKSSSVVTNNATEAFHKKFNSLNYILCRDSETILLQWQILKVNYSPNTSKVRLSFVRVDVFSKKTLAAL